MAKDNDVLDTLRQAKVDVATKRSLQRSLSLEAVRANAKADNATEALKAAETRYNVARKAASEAFPEAFKL
jgi:predicted RNA-binding protein with PUA-like domain